MNRVLLDTNVLVRFTFRDDPIQAAASDRLFASAAANQCLLASQSVTENASLATFDAGIRNKCPDLKFWDLAGSGG